MQQYTQVRGIYKLTVAAGGSLASYTRVMDRHCKYYKKDCITDMQPRTTRT